MQMPRGGPLKLSEEDKKRVVALANETDDLGIWKYSYQDIAAIYGINRSYVSIIVLAAGLAPRNNVRWRPPKEHEEMYRGLITKVGAIEARRILREHIETKARSSRGITP